MHFGNGMMTRCRDVLESEFEYCSDLNTTRFLKRMLEAEKPDFIAFTGTLFSSLFNRIWVFIFLFIPMENIYVGGYYYDRTIYIYSRFLSQKQGEN
jgi:hypothetical protein